MPTISRSDVWHTDIHDDATLRKVLPFIAKISRRAITISQSEGSRNDTAKAKAYHDV